MKVRFFLLLMVCGSLSGPQLTTCRADQTDEAALIETLQSATASPKAKAAACAQLKRIGTAQSIPALAALLTNQKLSHSARYALESMPDAKAGQALLEALPRTSGMLRVGIIDSLALRAEPAAVPPLGQLLSSPEENVAVASAEALGRIGGTKALKLLQHAISKATNSLHDAEVDGILVCANQMLDAGKPADALKAFRTLYTTEKPDRIRSAAFRGMILASGKKATALVADAIVNGDGAAQSTALHLAAGLPDKRATLVLAGLLPKTSFPVQKALLDCLVQRGDPAALPNVTPLASSSDSNLCVAAITALGTLGDDSVVKLLVEKAANGNSAERNAARESLLELNRGPVTSRLTALLQTPSPKTAPEVFRALSGRRDQAAVPALLDLAQQGDETERPAALQALGQLADATQIPRLVQIVALARDEQSRSDAADALTSVYQRVQFPGGNSSVEPLVAAIKTGATETRLALLPVCSGLAQAEVRGALRAAVTDSDARVSEAGIHALCETRDPELLPDLLKLACAQSEASSRPLAIRGCVRLTTQEEGVKFSNAQKLDALKQILGTTLSTPDKRLVLSALGTIADDQALTLAVGLLDDATVNSEAEQSVIKIAAATSGANPSAAASALKKALTLSNDPTTREAAQKALDKIK